MKRILGFILALVLVFTTFPAVTAASVPTMTMSSSSGHDVGDKVTLEISFDYGENKIKSITMDSFTYDKSVLKLKSLSWVVSGMLSSADPDGDSLIVFSSATKVSGVVMKAEVEVIGKSSDLTQKITFNSLVAPESGSNISAAVTEGVITLNSAKLTGTLALTGVTAPVKNGTPVGVSDVTPAENTTVTSVTWNPAHSTFAAKTAYSVTLNVKANGGYEFDKNVKFTVDGESWTAKKQSDGSYNLTKTFPKTADKETPVCVAPQNVTAIYGQKLSDITLVNPEGNTSGTWSWVSPDTSVGNASETPKNFKAKFVPDDDANFVTVENINVPVKVAAKNIEVSVAQISDQEYTGSQIKPKITVTGDGKTLVLDTDYTVEYGENVNVGENTGSVTVKAKTGGNYAFENATKKFNIVAKAGKVSVSGNLNVKYGNEVPDVTIDKNGSDGNTTVYYYTNAACTEGKTTVKPTSAGKYWVQVEMTAGTNFGSAVSNVLSFTISKADITPKVTVTGWTYKASANAPVVTGNPENGNVTYTYKVKGKSDKTYTQTVPTNAGEYTVKAEIEETANYNAGFATADFVVSPKAIDSSMVAEAASQAYTGSELKPTPAVTDGEALVKDTDFTYAYENNTYVGTTAKVKVVGKGNYTGTITKDFGITAVDQMPTITTAAFVTKGGNTIDLKALVANAKGDVTFAISGDADGCTIDGGVLTSGENAGSVKINVSIAAKDVNGDNVNEYNEYSLNDAITVTINEKEIQSALNITSKTTVTYGQTLTLKAEGGSGTGNITYAVTSGTGEAAIEGNVLTPKKAGTVTVVATKAEDTTYNNISSTPVTIKIEKATITVSAKNKTIYVKGTVPELGKDDYTVKGLVNGEALKTEPTVEYETTPDTTKTGSVAIKVYGAEAPDGDNYNEIVYNDSTLTIKKKSSGGGGGGSTTTTYTVKFETDGGSKIANKIVDKNEVIKAPDEPTKDGFKFEGWFVDKEFKTAYDFGEKVTKSFTLYAKWSEEKEKEEVEEKTEENKKDEDKPQTEEWKNPFGDVNENDWFYENIRYVAQNNLMNGTETDKFVPNGTLTRAMLVTVLYRAEGEPPVNKSIPFADVKADTYYASAVIWAQQNGIVTGVTETEFAPDDNITREQIATIMFRYAKYKGMDAVTLEENLGFDDADEISEYAVSAMNWAVGTGLMKGKTETTLNPKDFATRAEIAAILRRFAENVK